MMIYAPVLIPTLNRVRHLQELIESLRKNKYAKYTDLYISVDFPPNKKYEDGYTAVKKYIEDGIDGFGKVHVFFQEVNLGAAKNINFLMNEVKKDHDRFILTEDDNVFSPNFLEYMDKCLDKYESDMDVIAICGHIHDEVENVGSHFLIKNSVLFDGWGNGYWVKKDERLYEELNFAYLEGILQNWNRAWKLFKTNGFFFRLCVDCVIKHKGAMFDQDGKFILIDQVLTIYLNDANKIVINPAISKVKNCGDDGSGIHGGNEDKGKWQSIDLNESYNIESVEEYDNRKYLLDIYGMMFRNSWKRELYTLFIWVKYYIFRKLRAIRNV